MAHDRIVCRVNHKATTNRLLVERKLVFDKALELTKAIESAEKDARQIQDSPSTGVMPTQVHHATNRNRKAAKFQIRNSWERSRATDTADLI